MGEGGQGDGVGPGKVCPGFPEGPPDGPMDGPGIMGEGGNGEGVGPGKSGPMATVCMGPAPKAVISACAFGID